MRYFIYIDVNGHLVRHSLHVLHQVQVCLQVRTDPLAYHPVYQVDGSSHLTEDSVSVLPGRGGVWVSENTLGAGDQEDGGPDIN